MKKINIKLHSTPVVARTRKLGGVWQIATDSTDFPARNDNSLDPDRYVNKHKVDYADPVAFGYTTVNVLDFLKGRLLDKVVMAYVHSLRPSSIRIIPDGSGMTMDHITWRVTIHTFKVGKRTYVKLIEQEVQVGLPNGVAGGAALQDALNYGIDSKAVKWWQNAGMTLCCSDGMYKITPDGKRVKRSNVKDRTSPTWYYDRK